MSVISGRGAAPAQGDAEIRLALGAGDDHVGARGQLHRELDLDLVGPVGALAQLRDDPLDGGAELAEHLLEALAGGGNHVLRAASASDGAAGARVIHLDQNRAALLEWHLDQLAHVSDYEPAYRAVQGRMEILRGFAPPSAGPRRFTSAWAGSDRVWTTSSSTDSGRRWRTRTRRRAPPIRAARTRPRSSPSCTSPAAYRTPATCARRAPGTGRRPPTSGISRQPGYARCVSEQPTVAFFPEPGAWGPTNNLV